MRTYLDMPDPCVCSPEWKDPGTPGHIRSEIIKARSDQLQDALDDALAANRVLNLDQVQAEIDAAGKMPMIEIMVEIE